MKGSIRVKRGFTLIELLLVIILVSTIAFLFYSNFNFNTQKKYKVNLENIKEFLLKNFEFNKEISLKCIENDNLDCFVFIDGIRNNEVKIGSLFPLIPEVYIYNRELDEYKFPPIRLDDIEYSSFFELNIDIDRKHKNIVLDTLDGKVYLFSSIRKKPELFDGTNEIIDRFLELETEVRDAL